MDPTPNTASFHLPEIWHFPPERKPQFGHSFGDFATEDPVGSEQTPVNHGRKRRDMEEDLVKGVSTSNDGGNGANDDGSGVGKKSKTLGNNKGEVMVTEENSSGKHAEQTSEPPSKQDFIHVRARRGQATDSHSLAERARREKISERMKTLQDLVPGCNKVIGKALVLDEIINYIQSLHHQVEFLSMKLEAVNSRLTPGIEVFPPKDVTHFDQQTYDTTTIPFTPQATREYSRASSPEWLHMQVGSGFERAT